MEYPKVPDILWQKLAANGRFHGIELHTKDVALLFSYQKTHHPILPLSKLVELVRHICAQLERERGTTTSITGTLFDAMHVALSGMEGLLLAAHQFHSVAHLYDDRVRMPVLLVDVKPAVSCAERLSKDFAEDTKMTHFSHTENHLNLAQGFALFFSGCPPEMVKMAVCAFLPPDEESLLHDISPDFTIMRRDCLIGDQELKSLEDLRSLVCQKLNTVVTHYKRGAKELRTGIATALLVVEVLIVWGSALKRGPCPHVDDFLKIQFTSKEKEECPFLEEFMRQPNYAKKVKEECSVLNLPSQFVNQLRAQIPKSLSILVKTRERIRHTISGTWFHAVSVVVEGIKHLLSAAREYQDVAELFSGNIREPNQEDVEAFIMKMDELREHFEDQPFHTGKKHWMNPENSHFPGLVSRLQKIPPETIRFLYKERLANEPCMSSLLKRLKPEGVELAQAGAVDAGGSSNLAASGQRAEGESQFRRQTREERYECMICFESEVTTLLTPCNHACVCWGKCANVIDKCPICRKSIEGRHRIFLR